MEEKWIGKRMERRRNKYRLRVDNGLFGPFKALEWNSIEKIIGEARGLYKAYGNHADGLQGTLQKADREGRKRGKRPTPKGVEKGRNSGRVMEELYSEMGKTWRKSCFGRTLSGEIMEKTRNCRFNSEIKTQ